MVTQEFISNLWTPVLTYKNEAVFQSHNAESTPRSSTTLTPQPSNPIISMGNSVDGYRAPVQFIRVQPPSIPPRFRERNVMNPMKQHIMPIIILLIRMAWQKTLIINNLHRTYIIIEIFIKLQIGKIFKY